MSTAHTLTTPMPDVIAASATAAPPEAMPSASFADSVLNSILFYSVGGGCLRLRACAERERERI